MEDKLQTTAIIVAVILGVLVLSAYAVEYSVFGSIDRDVIAEKCNEPRTEGTAFNERFERGFIDAVCEGIEE